MDETFPALRVSQLDASTLDSELENIVDAQFKKFLESIPGRDFSWLEPEFVAGLKSIFWFFVFRNEGATIGQKMMDMSYRRSSTSFLDQRGKWAYLFFLIVLPWFRQRMPTFLGWKSERWKDKSERWLDNSESIFEMVNLLHFVWFLNRGGFRTVWERILGFRAVHNSQPFLEEMDTDLTERELLWHGFSDILIFFVPLISYRRFYNAILRLGKRVRRSWSKTKADKSQDVGEKKIKRADVLSPCGYCEKTPVLPSHPGCGHVYCYYCLAANLEADRNFSCLVCGHMSSDGKLILVTGSKIIE